VQATTILYRPVGLRELEAVLEHGAFPAPPGGLALFLVFNGRHAEEVAKEMNAGDPASGFAGFVTAWRSDARFLERYDAQIVGAAPHRALWVPAADLPAFNAHIRGGIHVISAFYGPDYAGPEPLPTMLNGLGPAEQLETLGRVLDHDGMDFLAEVSANWKVVAANYLLWRSQRPPGDRVLAAIEAAWKEYPRGPGLPGSPSDVLDPRDAPGPAGADAEPRLHALAQIAATAAVALLAALVLVAVMTLVSWMFR